MSIPSYPFHFLILKLLNNWMNFPFPPLKLPKTREWKNILKLFSSFIYIPFYSLLTFMVEYTINVRGENIISMYSRSTNNFSFLFGLKCSYLCLYLFQFILYNIHWLDTHTHTHTYIYIYIFWLSFS